MTQAPASFKNSGCIDRVRSVGAASLLVLTVLAAAGVAKGETGSIPGHFSVDRSGQAQYQISIAVPPGISGQRPHLALQYNSNGQNGLAGVGWSVTGLVAIQRVPRIRAIDGVAGAVTFSDATDRLALGAARLIVTSGTYGDVGAVYSTEKESWQKVTAVACGETIPCADLPGNPQLYFTVATKDGAILEFGSTPSSRISSSVAGTDYVRVWALAKKTDRTGNTQVFTYESYGGQYYPSLIEYGFSQGGGSSTTSTRSVQFTYQDRPDVTQHFVGGASVSNPKRLATIETFVGTTSVQSYSLLYEPKGSPTTGRSRLQSISLAGGALTVPPTQFEWRDGEASFEKPKEATSSFTSRHWMARTLADVNGDGRADLVGINRVIAEPGVYVSLGQSDGKFKPKSRWSPAFTGNDWSAGDGYWFGDVNGDGLTDVIGRNAAGITAAFSTGDSFGALLPPSYFSGNSWADALFRLGDVNADGYIDVVGFSSSIQVALGGVAGFTQGGWAQDWAEEFVGNQWPTSSVRNLADMNGDGQQDIFGLLGEDIYVALSTGSGWTLKGWKQEFDTESSSAAFRTMSDINGDSLADFVTFNSQGVQVGYSTGIGFAKMQPACAAFGGNQWPSSALRTLADVNGDGLADVVGFGADGVSFGVSGSQSEECRDFNIDLWSELAAFTYQDGWVDQPRIVGDVNGDGMPDIVGIKESASVLVALSAGNNPDRLEKVTNGFGESISSTYAPISNPMVYSASHGNSNIDFQQGSRIAVDGWVTGVPTHHVRSLLGGHRFVVDSYEIGYAASSVAGANYSYKFSLTYSGAKYDYGGRGWLGFGAMNLVNETTGLERTTSYHLLFPCTGLVSNAVKQCANGALDPLCSPGAKLKTEDMTYSVNQALSCSNLSGFDESKVATVLKKSHTYGTWDYGAQAYAISREYEYDNFGNITLDAYIGYVDPQTGRDLTSDDNLYTLSSYYPTNVDNWVFGRLEYLKHSKVSTGEPIGQFDPSSDLSLEHRTYNETALGPLTIGRWDDQNDVFLTYSYAYDTYGNLVTATTPGSATATYEYDEKYHTYLDTLTSPNNKAGFPLVTKYAYDPRFGTQIGMMAPSGAVTIRVVDDLGRPLAKQRSVPEKPIGVETDLNLLGDVATGSGLAAMQAAKVVTTSQHTYGEDEVGAFTQVQVLQAWTTGTGPPSARSHKIYLDGMGRKVRAIVDSESSPIIADNIYFYGHALHSSSFPYFSGDAAQLQTNTYDVLTRPLSTTRPLPPDGATSTTTTYSYKSLASCNSSDTTPCDEVTKVLAFGSPDSYTAVHQSEYVNGLSYVMATILPSVMPEAVAVTRFGYGVDGHLELVTTPSETEQSYAYDSLGRVVSSANVSRGSTTFKYSAQTGFLHTVSDALGTTTYSHDDLGRVLSKTYLITNSNIPTVIESEWDSKEYGLQGLGRIGRIETREGESVQFVSNFGYNQEGAVTIHDFSEADEQGFSSTWVRDPLGRLLARTYPDSIVATFDYGQAYLDQISLDGNLLAKYTEFTPFGMPRQIAYANRLVTAAEYAPSGELTTLSTSNSNNGVAVSATTVTRNSLLEITELADSVAPTLSQSFPSYPLRRLGSAEIQNGEDQLQYKYKDSGNIYPEDGVTYTYSGYQLESGTRGAETVLSATYGPTGDLVTLSDLRSNPSSLTRKFTYDNRDRLAQVFAGNSLNTSYDYDHRLARAAKTNHTLGIRTIHVDPDVEVDVDTASGSRSLTKYLHSPYGLVAAVTSGTSVPGAGTHGIPKVGSLFFHTNALGNTWLTTDTQGDPTAKIAYEPFGQFKILTGEDGSRPKFSGRTFDGSAGLYDFGARYYDPSLKRFISADTRVGAQSRYRQDAYNAYAYALNDPVNYADPTGHSAESQGAMIAISAVEILAATALTVVSDGAGIELEELSDIEMTSVVDDADADVELTELPRAGRLAKITGRLAKSQILRSASIGAIGGAGVNGLLTSSSSGGASWDSFLISEASGLAGGAASGAVGVGLTGSIVNKAFDTFLVGSSSWTKGALFLVGRSGAFAAGGLAGSATSQIVAEAGRHQNIAAHFNPGDLAISSAFGGAAGLLAGFTVLRFGSSGAAEQVAEVRRAIERFGGQASVQRLRSGSVWVRSGSRQGIGDSGERVHRPTSYARAPRLTRAIGPAVFSLHKVVRHVESEN